ncbi:MAG: MBL fold metallo-hydrolase, partial [Promethearchaeota archaeon]
MSHEEFKVNDISILIEKKEELPSSFKIKSYLQKLKLMEEQNIFQKDIREVLNHFFKDNDTIPENTKKSISKIIYCQKDRIIIIITEAGKQIIWKRNELIKAYGWFFFVANSDVSADKGPEKKDKKKKKEKHRKEEKTISIEQYQFEDLIIPLKEKENMRSLYNSREYHQYLNLINKKKIPQMPIKEVLKDFFFVNEDVPIKEKKAIGKIIYYLKERVIVIKSLIGDKMYEHLKQLVLKYGWYFYITGVPVGPSEISIAIDKIEKKFSSDHFKSISLINDNLNQQDVDVFLYPVSLKPNHNCHILNMGDFNILLDCGIEAEDFQNIDDFFSIIKNRKNNPIEEVNNEQEELKEVDDLIDFDREISSEERKYDNDGNDLYSSQEQISEFEPKIDAIFISHSHFDHLNGLKELISKYPDIPILCSRITLDLYLLRDSDFLKQDTHDKIDEEEYISIIRNVIYVENGSKIEFKIKNCYLSFYHAGHMPGALMILAKVKNFRFLYTGDYTYWDLTPFAGTKKFLEQISRPIDFLLIDSTSAYEEFEKMADQINSLLLFLDQKAEYEDNCLIGADPSSLAITFMLTIWRHFRKKQLRRNYQKRPNIYVDMMVRKNIQVINHRYEYIYGPISKLIKDKANPFNSIKFRWFDYSDLDFLKTKNNIIISHPPDLSYGIIRNVVNFVGRNPHNLVYLAGAIHEEPGVSLIYPPEPEEEIEINDNLNGKDEESDNMEVSSEDLTKEPLIKSEAGIITEDPLAETPTEEYDIINVEIPIKDGVEKDFKPKVIRKDESSPPDIYFTEDWIVTFRALLLNKFAPNLKIKLHGDKKQLLQMIRVLEPKEICFF